MITAAEFRHGCCGQGTPVQIRCGKPESSSVPPVNRSRIASCTYDCDFNGRQQGGKLVADAMAFKVGRSRRPLTDTERDMVADAIVEHLQLANWKIDAARHGGGFRHLGRPHR
jgi:hypothetical protein